MSDMNGNPHYSGSLQFSGWARNGRKPTDPDLTPEAAAFREYALTQATLALAYEQRTANLIAVMAMSPLDLTDWPQPAVSSFLTQNNNIMTRLGLNEGATK